MQQDSKTKLSTPTIVLHWLVAVTMIFLIVVGIVMTETDNYDLYAIHKSVGVSVFILVLLRVIWRLKNGWPPAASQYKKYEQILAKITHWALIISTVAMPISGVMMSGLGGYGVDVFGFTLISANPDPDNAGKMLAYHSGLAEIGHEVHEIFANIIFFGVILHIVGALKHHLIDKDGTLKRMLGATIS